MKRNLMKSLKEWKNSPYRKPLILSGARQVGKTWLMKEFGRTEYTNTVYVNFDQDINAAGLFEGSINPDRIILGLRALSGMEIDPDNTLIIFDEVQEAPRALTSLKYFLKKRRSTPSLQPAPSWALHCTQGHPFPLERSTECIFIH